MKLVIKNLGVIDNAEININGLTILAGPNGSGKTTVAKAFGSIGESIVNRDQLRSEFIARYFRNEIANNLLGFLKGNNINWQKIYSEQTLLEIGLFLDQVVKGSYDDIIIYVNNFLSETNSNASPDYGHFMDNFTNVLLPKLAEDARRLGAVYISAYARPIFNDLKKYLPSVPTETNNTELRLLDQNGTSVFNFNYFNSFNMDTSKSSDFFFDYFFSNVIYYDNINFQKIKNVNPDNNLFLDGIKNTLSETIGGSIDFDSFNGLKFKDKFGGSYGLGVLASGIKWLAPFYQLLQENKLQPNTALIIDEPETNLHTEWQVKFAEILTKLVYKGVTILVSTHSPIFASAIERYAKKNGINAYTSWYLAEQSEMNGKATFTDCTHDVDQLLHSMFAPFHRLVWAS